MALSDYIENKAQTGVPFTVKAPAIDTLAKVDDQMRSAQQAAQIRGKREELMRQIENLKAQNDKLRARRDNIKANSLSDMSEDKIVAMAKAKGIDDKDIETWLRGRAQRSARSVSEGQKKALEEQADAMREQNKANDVQAIFDADAEYTRAFEEAKMATDEKAASTDKNVLSKKNKLDTLKNQFFKNYGVKWESYTKTEDAPKSASEGNPEDKTVAEVVDVTLTTEEEDALKGNKKTRDLLTKFNERDTTNKEKRSIKQTAQNTINDKAEADRQRKEELLGIKADLQTLGIKTSSDARKILSSFEKSEDRNDPAKRGAVDRVRQFLKGEKKYKSYSELVKLLQMK